MARHESQYIVYRWEEGGELEFVRSIFVRHEIGEAVTDEMVREQIAVDVEHFPHGKYRAVPFDRKVDITITSNVEIAA